MNKALHQKRNLFLGLMCLGPVLLVGCQHSAVVTPSPVAPSPVAPSLKVISVPNLSVPMLNAQERYQQILFFRKALQTNPHNTSYKIGLANLLYRQGKTREAISILKEAEKTSTDPGLTRTAHQYAIYLEGIAATEPANHKT